MPFCNEGETLAQGNCHNYTFWRRERPHVVLGPDGHTPVAITTAVIDSPLSPGSSFGPGPHDKWSDSSYTLLQPVRKTDDEDRNGPHAPAATAAGPTPAADVAAAPSSREGEAAAGAGEGAAAALLLVNVTTAVFETSARFLSFAVDREWLDAPPNPGLGARLGAATPARAQRDEQHRHRLPHGRRGGGGWEGGRHARSQGRRPGGPASPRLDPSQQGLRRYYSYATCSSQPRTAVRVVVKTQY